MVKSYIFEPSKSNGQHLGFTWVCDDYTDQVTRERTRIGDLVYDAKYCARAPAMHQLQSILRHAALQLRTFPIHNLGEIDLVVHVPANPPKVPFNLPTKLAESVAAGLGVVDISSHVVKICFTPGAKTRPGLHPDAYATSLDLTGRRVLVVDDVYGTGGTLESVATVLSKAGAVDVIGLCAAKAVHGLT